MRGLASHYRGFSFHLNEWRAIVGFPVKEQRDLTYVLKG